MGGGGKGGTSTSTVSIPPEVLARYNAVNARAEEVAKKPFEAYTGEFVAPVTQEQQQGITQTQQYSEAAQPYYARAAGMTEEAYKASQPLTAEQIQQYQNPYIQSVVDPTLRALQQQQAIDRQSQSAQAIRSGAFGGDRAGLQRAALAGQQELAQAQAINPLYASAYQNALATAQQQQQQRVASGLQAGQQVAGIGTGAQQAGLQGAQATIGAGTLKQQTQQAQDTARYQQFLQERGYDFQTAQFLANIAEGTGALSGSTTTTTQPTSFFSDKRLKHDIKKIGKTNDGLPIYSFKYHGDDRTQIGLIAQDVEKKRPEAVGMFNGYKTVDYEKATAGARHARAMGGLIPESMGGAVFEPGNFSRGGFAVGGGQPIDDVLAQQARMYGMEGQQGGAGQSGAMVPYVSKQKMGLGIPNAQRDPYRRLMTPTPIPQQPSGLQTAMQNIAAAGKTAETLSGGYDWGKKALVGTAPGKDREGTGGLIGWGGKAGATDPNAPKPNTQPPAGSPPPADTGDKSWWEIWKGAHGGGVMPRNHYGTGGITINPYEEPTSGSMVPEEVMQDSEATKDKAESQMIKPDGSKGGSGSGGGGLMGAASTLGTLYGAGKALGAAGSFLAALPIFSDERLKDNIKHVGKTFDGQNIYSYDMGDGRTQMGLLAQEVLHHKPEAVGKDHGYLTVDYHKATEDAVPHRASGGVVPRLHFLDGGNSPQLPTPQDIYNHAISTGASPQAALMLTGAAASESNFNPTAQHDKDPQTGQYTGYGLFGHRLDRLDAMRQFAGTDNPDWKQQVAYAVKETQVPSFQSILANAKTPEDITKAQMHFERPKGYTRDRPELGHNYSGRLASINAFMPLTTGGDIDYKPAQQQQQQQPYPGQQVVERGLGAAKDLSARLVPTDYAGRNFVQNPETGEKRARSWGDFLTSRDFILPLMSGLGTMASSPSRYLGAAVLQGLGGAAAAYQGVQNQQLQRDQALAQTGLTKAQTGLTGAQTVRASIIDSGAGPLVAVPNPEGGYRAIRAFEYFALPVDQRAALGLSADEIQKLKVQADKEGGVGIKPPPGTTTTLPAATTTTVTPPPAPEAPQIGARAPIEPPIPNPSILTPQEKETVQRNLTAAQAANAGTDYYTKQKERADAAQNQQALLRDLATSMARLPETGSPTVAGRLSPLTVGGTEVVSNLLKILGRDPSKLGIADTTDPQEIAKIIKNIAGDRQYQGNIHAHAVLDDIAQRFPTMINTREGQAKLMASVMSLQRREIDKYDYNNALLQHANSIDPRMGSLSGRDNERLFDQRYGTLYPKEEEVLKKMFLAPMVVDGKKQVDPQTNRPISQMEYLHKFGNQLTPAELVAIENQLKAPRVLRYFGLYHD